MTMKRVPLHMPAELVERLDAVVRGDHSVEGSRARLIRRACRWWVEWIETHGEPPPPVRPRSER